MSCFVCRFNAKINLLQKIIQCTSIRNCFNCQITQKHVLSFCIGLTAMGQKKQVVLTLYNNHSQRTVSWYLLKVLKGLEAFLQGVTMNDSPLHTDWCIVVLLV